MLTNIPALAPLPFPPAPSEDDCAKLLVGILCIPTDPVLSAITKQPVSCAWHLESKRNDLALPAYSLEVPNRYHWVVRSSLTLLSYVSTHKIDLSFSESRYNFKYKHMTVFGELITFSCLFHFCFRGSDTRSDQDLTGFCGSVMQTCTHEAIFL